MKPSYLALFFSFFLLFNFDANAAGSALRIVCDGEDVGAEVYLNNKFRGECPVDIRVAEGKYKLKVVKAVDASHERIFEQDLRLAEGTAKKVEAALTTRLTAAAQRLEGQRLAAERAEVARMRAKFNADMESGAIRAAFSDCPDCPEMVAIPPGNFDMGSDNGDSDERPVHRVTISHAFAIGKTEVTQGQWKAVMGNNPSRFTGCGDNCPVENVNWNDAQEFIRKLNQKTGKQYRLPSEAEWEYACRAGGRHEYCGGDDINAVAWWGAYANPKGNSEKTPNPVSRKQANAFGIHDMSGNVGEWVEDSHHDSYSGAPTDGSAWQGNGARRVLRGGSWGVEPRSVRTADRNWSEPEYRNFSLSGFRLARTLP